VQKADQPSLFFEQERILSLDQPREAGTSITWSYSRRDRLEQCPLWYYFHYYGGKTDTAKTEPRKERLRFLRKLSNRYLRVGDITHIAARSYLNALQRGEQWELNRVLNWARGIFRHDIEYSQNFNVADGNCGEVDFPPALLMELYFAIDGAEQLLAEAEERLVNALTNFVGSSEVRPFLAGGRRTSAIVEKPVNLKDGMIRVKGKIDLAYLDNGRVHVVDWKIGSASGGDSSLQLLSYAIACMNEFSCQAEDIDLFRVELIDKVITPSVVTEGEILRAKMRIVQDLQKMEILDIYGRNAVAGAFTPCGQKRICSLCPYQEFCP